MYNVTCLSTEVTEKHSYHKTAYTLPQIPVNSQSYSGCDALQAQTTMMTANTRLSKRPSQWVSPEAARAPPLKIWTKFIIIIFSQVSTRDKNSCSFKPSTLSLSLAPPSSLSSWLFHLQEVSISLIYMWKNLEHHVVRVQADPEFHSVLISSLTVTIESILFTLPSPWPPQRSQIAFHLMCQSPSDHVRFSLPRRHHMTC